MKILLWVIATLLLIGVVVFGLQVVASETGEVVVLTTKRGAGETTTRLWVVDHDDVQWLRGGRDSGWYLRLAEDPVVRMRRGDRVGTYVASAEPAMTAHVHALMAAKYGWRDDLISMLVGGRENDVAVRLTPTD